MADRLVTFRVPPEWEPTIESICQEHNITRSEYIRGLIAANLEGMPPGMISLGGFNEGYQQGRALATKLAYGMLNEASKLIPSTYEEAIARYPAMALGRPKQVRED